MKMLKFWPRTNVTPEQKLEHKLSMDYLMEKNVKGSYIHGSLGLRSILLFLLKQEDIYKIETEVSFCKNKRLKSDIVITFTNNSKGVIEFNGTQHFVWSNWYPDKQSFTKQNVSLISKELNCIEQGYSCLNFNDLTYLNTPLEKIDDDPYNDMRDKILFQYQLFFKSMRNGDNEIFRQVLNKMKKEVNIFSYNLKLQNRNWRNGFRNSSNKELDQIMFNLCNDDTFVSYI